ncbi:MAG: hypothetical protein HC786_23790 [Richelia sp. CSU_2_1]|nr:hypothetical protein [Microcoleus sp. SU_5_6]NJR24965.1 hypothetical protein [Richelia sp. CSU_2_1]
MIPKQSETSFSIDRLCLLSAIERVALLSAKESRMVKISIGQKNLTVSTEGKDIGSGKESVEIESLEGEPMDLAFNIKYLTDILRTTGSSKVCFLANKPLSPVIVRPDGAEKTIFLVVPMQPRA